MSLHPFFPPSWPVYVVVAVVIGLLAWVVIPRKRDPFWIFFSAISAFLPLLLGAIWLFWAFTEFGRSGYAGARDPREIFEALIGSFLQGAIFTVLLLVFEGFLIWRLRRKSRLTE